MISFSILSSGCISHPLEIGPGEVCEWDWKWEITKSIGVNKVSPGYTYAVVTLYVKNNAGKSISTSPWNWELIGNGVKYLPDNATYDYTIRHQTVKVTKGQQFTTKIVFLVHDNVRVAQLQYNGLHPPPMKQISILV